MVLSLLKALVLECSVLLSLNYANVRVTFSSLESSPGFLWDLMDHYTLCSWSPLLQRGQLSWSSFLSLSIFSAIYYGVVCWGSGISAGNRKRLYRLVWRTSSVLDCPLDSEHGNEHQNTMIAMGKMCNVTYNVLFNLKCAIFLVHSRLYSIHFILYWWYNIFILCVYLLLTLYCPLLPGQSKFPTCGT